MHETPKNSVSFKVYGRYALFTDPVTRVGGEKCSYHLPTYEAIKGVLKSIYWKPTFIWVVDRVRVMKPLRTQTKGVKPLKFYERGNELSIHTFLRDVEYQVQAHFEWNEHRPELAQDRVDGKHHSIALRSIDKGGRQDVFLGVRDCQAYVEPCAFGEGTGEYDQIDELGFGIMFHSFGYPDEVGGDVLCSHFWRAAMKRGIVDFPRPDQCEVAREVRKMTPKQFGVDDNLRNAEQEAALP